MPAMDLSEKPEELFVALRTAERAADEYMAKNPENQDHWYPCGFAWVSFPKIRKNAKESAELIAHGWRWDDYLKRYTLWGGHFSSTQSMDYKEAVCDAYSKTMRSLGYNTSVSTRID